jgi:hypothetical protein
MWTVHLATDERGLDGSGALALETAIGRAQRVTGIRVDTRPTLAFTVVVDRNFPTEALDEVLTACRREMRNAVGGDLQPVRIECVHGDRPDWRPGRLITHRGLAERFGVSEAWARKLMTDDNCPVDPVPVEGGDRAAIYPAEPAVAYMATKVRRLT